MLQVYNTLTRAKAPFQPVKPGEVGLYLCGVTVYSDCHIGHLMGPVLFDAVARWFAVRGYRVRFVNNLTDIDDKIIQRSRESGEPWQAITARYAAQYNELLRRLRVASITDQPRCTDYVPQMVAYVQELIATGRAYVVEGDGVYYDVLKQPAYGKLSGRKLDDMISGSRIERDSRLHHPADFALWKLTPPGEPSWPSPWGEGRPGWHIECSVMSLHTLGDTFDIHAGGEELKFPHHENEIAQGEAHGGGYARCWMHNNLVQFEGAKVSKSDPRMKDPAFAGQFRAVNVVERFGGPAVRFLLLQGHYRRPVDFAPAAITAARTALQRLLAQLGPLAEEPLGPAILPATDGLPATAQQALAVFAAAMDDDFNTGAAIAALFTLSSESRHLTGSDQTAALRCLRDLGRLIGLFQPGDSKDPGADKLVAADDGALGKVMGLVLDLRQEARARKDFATSDRIRDRLKEAGIVIKDGKDGATWERG